MQGYYQTEIELFKIFCLGLFIGWQFRKYILGHGRNMPWTTIKNMKYQGFNKREDKPLKFSEKMNRQEKI